MFVDQIDKPNSVASDHLSGLVVTNGLERHSLRLLLGLGLAFG